MPLLFVIVVNVIIVSLQASGMGYRDKEVYIPALFYADDGLLISNDRKEVEIMELLTQKVEECGLQISKIKSECMIINRKKEQEMISGMKVVEQVKYLGIIVTDKKNYLRNIRIKKSV